jgi:hypothetical protein
LISDNPTAPARHRMHEDPANARFLTNFTSFKHTLHPSKGTYWNSLNTPSLTMTTSITSPTSLATFSIPHASSSKIPHVTLSPVYGEDNVSRPAQNLGGSSAHNTNNNNNNGYTYQRQAVAAVQGDGVWTYDVGSGFYDRHHPLPCAATRWKLAGADV